MNDDGEYQLPLNTHEFKYLLPRFLELLAAGQLNVGKSKHERSNVEGLDQISRARDIVEAVRAQHQSHLKPGELFDCSRYDLYCRITQCTYCHFIIAETERY